MPRQKKCWTLLSLLSIYIILNLGCRSADRVYIKADLNIQPDKQQSISVSVSNFHGEMQ